MPNLGEIKTRVENRLIDTNATILAESGLYINKALRMFQELYNFKVMEEKTEYITVDITRKLTDEPSDWKESRLSPWIREWDGGTTLIEWIPNLQEVAKLYSRDDTNDKGAPRHLLYDNFDIEVYPFPDLGSRHPTPNPGDWRIVVPYYKYLAPLVNNGDTNWFTENAEWMLTFQATAEGFWTNWDEQRAQFWEVRAANEFKRLKKTDKSIRTNRPSDTLTPRYNVQGAYNGGK